MKQYRYNLNNVVLNFIASYANVVLSDDHLFFVNTLTDRQVTLYGDHNALENLLTGLENGVSDQKLLELLSAFPADGLLETLLQEGMIE